MKRIDLYTNILSLQFPVQFQFLTCLYQDVEIVQVYVFEQDNRRNCKSQLEIELEVLK